MWQMNPSLVKRKGQVKDNENDEEQRKEPKRAKVELALESAAGTDDAKKKTAVAPKQKVSAIRDQAERRAAAGNIWARWIESFPNPFIGNAQNPIPWIIDRCGSCHNGLEQLSRCHLDLPSSVQPLTPEQVVEWHRLNDERWTAYHRLRVPVVGSADGKMTIPVHVLTAGRVEGREDGSLHFHFIAVELLTMPISAPCAMEKKAYHFPCQLVTMALPVAVSRADGGYALSFSCTDGFGVHPYIEALPAADAAFALQSKNPDAATFSLSKNQWNELLETRDIPGDFNDVEFHPRLDMCQLGAFLQRIPGSPGDGDDDDGEYDVDLVGGDGDGDVGGDDEKKFRLDLPSLAWEDHFNPKSPLDNPTKEDTLQQISPLQHILEHQLSFDLFLIVLGYTNIGFMPTYPEVISSYLVSPMLLQRKFRQQRPSTSSTSSSASSSASSTPESEKKKRILDVITKTLVFPPLPPL